MADRVSASASPLRRDAVAARAALDSAGKVIKYSEGSRCW